MRNKRVLIADQLQVAYVDEEPRRLSQNENDVLFVDRVCQQHCRTAETKVPEGFRYDAAFFTFAAKPLHDEPGCEQELACQTECYPDLFVRHKLHPFFPQLPVCFDAKAMRHP